MGADIYLMSVSEACRAAHEELFERAVKERDNARTDAERKAAQKKVAEAYDGMYAQGYFRDSYNPGSFAWLIGLSWWKDVIPMLDEEGCLPIERAKELRERISKEKITEERVAKYLCEKPDEFAKDKKGKLPVKGWTKRWKQDQKELIKLIDQSIELDEPLRCSL